MSAVKVTASVPSLTFTYTWCFVLADKSFDVQLVCKEMGKKALKLEAMALQIRDHLYNHFL